MKTVPLYPGAEKKSYYKFLQPITQPSEEEIRWAKTHRGDPKLALPFAKRAIIQTSEYTPLPEGVYFAEDGTIFVSAITPIPDITGEMLEWWMLWHQFDPLRYALWNPVDHYDVKITPEDRARFLDESIPIRERLWGTSSTILESMNGEKPMPGTLKFVAPSSVGLRNELVGTDSCQAILVANNALEIGPIKYPVFMCEWVRKNEQGKNEWVVAAWMGHGVKDGKDVTVKLPLFLRKKLASGMPSLFLVHNHKEVGHLNKILPALYAENKDNWLE